MNTLALIFLFQVVSLATAGVIIPTAEIIEGPSSKTTLVGPDGSVITSVAQGAKIVADGHSALVSGPDTTALLKSADHPVALESKIQPVISVPAKFIESHVINPVVASKTVSEYGQVVAHGHSALSDIHVEPLVAQAPIVAAKTSIASGHLQPVVAALSVPVVSKKIVEPVIAHQPIALSHSKTTISEQSQTIVHPQKLVKSYEEPLVAVHAPLLKTNAAILQHQVEPVIATHNALVYPVVQTKAAIVEPVVSAHKVEPAVPVFQTHAAVGAKTTVSEHLQKIAHSSALLQSEPVVAVHSLPVVTKEALPLVYKTEPVVAAHSVPVLEKQVYHSVVAAHPVPVIAAKTHVVENAQILGSHYW